MAILSLKQKVGLELDRQVRKNHKQLHPLRQLFWECTLRCNLHCKHCGSDCKTESLAPDMPAADFLKVIDEIGLKRLDARHREVIELEVDDGMRLPRPVRIVDGKPPEQLAPPLKERL